MYAQGRLEEEKISTRVTVNPDRGSGGHGVRWSEEGKNMEDAWRPLGMKEKHGERKWRT